MSLRTGTRLTVFLVAACAVVVPRLTFAGCAVTKGDVDNNGNTDLRIVGDTLKQNIVVELHDGGYRVQVDCNGDGLFTGATDIDTSGTDQIETYLIAGGGNDTITVRQTDNLVGSSNNIVVAMLVGASKFTFLSQGFGMSSQTNMAIDLVGGPSPENVTLDFTGSTIDHSLVTVRGELNGGNNACATTGPAALTDSIFDLNLGMGVGNTNAAYIDGGGVVTRSTLNVRFVGGDFATTGDT